MRTCRYLTLEEAALIEEAVERWLRMRDVEFNAGEWAAALLAEAHLRDPGCRRRDIASLGRSILLEVPHEAEPAAITLVRPGEEDPRHGRVSILSDVGLACIGQVVCSEIRLPHGTATFIGFADTRPFDGGVGPIPDGRWRRAPAVSHVVG
jgi:transcription elongation GreA/GreB family factor